MHASYRSVEEVVRHEWARLYACLAKWCGDFDLAEESLQEAFVRALEHWPTVGVPESPDLWLLKTAKRKAIDRIRRQKSLQKKQRQSSQLELLHERHVERGDPVEVETIEDERLRLIFTCCHPSLTRHAQIALTLRTVGGLETPEIARAFLVGESTMQQRLVRAKNKIRKARIPFKVPELDQWQERLSAVLAVIYLVFNEGYYAGQGKELVRTDLCGEAIYLCRTLNQLIPDDPEVLGLLAMMLLHDSRRMSRFSATMDYVTLEEQNRSLWNKESIVEGLKLLEKSFSFSSVGEYQIQAAISALHAQAPDFAGTDWRQIWFLYNRLYAISPNPVVRLNAVVALSYLEDAEHALQELKKFEDEKSLQGYQPYHAAKADLLRRNGQVRASIESYQRALELSGNDVEVRFLTARITELKACLI